MGDLFRIKSKMLHYENVMGINKINGEGVEFHDHLERNAERFAKLPEKLKINLKKNYVALKVHLQESFGQKLQRLLQLFVHEISLYEITWIFFSITISIMLLKRVEGAHHAMWILPVLSILFLLENQVKGIQQVDQEKSLFPSEQEIVKIYLKEPLSTDILKQREQLLEGWHIYLIKEWAHETPSQDLNSFRNQAEEGEFRFDIHRLITLEQVSQKFSLKKPALFLLCLYVGWNLFFAWYVNRHGFYTKPYSERVAMH